MRADDYFANRIDYLALGDSFSSGEGETSDAYYLGGTNDIYEKCHVSSRSYPFLIARQLSISPNFMKSVACSGAETKDVVGLDDGYNGQGDRLGLSDINFTSSDMVLAKYQAINDFIPGRIHQEDFVDKYQPKAITVGLGGNDAGFMDVLQTCLMPGTCEAAGTLQGREKMALEVQGVYGKLVDTYKKIHVDSPNSKIYAIGYPQIINPDGMCLGTASFLDSTERQFVYEGIRYLNRVVAAAAKAAGVKYVDIENSYGQNVICGLDALTAVNLIRLGDDIIDPFKDVPFVNMVTGNVIGNESFHPTPVGHQLDALSIANSVPNILTDDYCGNGMVVCPDDSVVAPEPSLYWLPDGKHNYMLQKITKLLGAGGGVRGITAAEIVNIALGSQSLQPGSLVSVAIHSNPIALGEFTVAGDGSVSVNITIPDGLEDGYHTIHLYGTSYSGEAIDLYQVVAYKKPRPVVSQPLTQPQPPVQPAVDNQDNTKAKPDSVAVVVAAKTEPKVVTYQEPLVHSAVLGEQSGPLNQLSVINSPVAPDAKDVKVEADINGYLIACAVVVVIALVMIFVTKVL